MFETFELSFKRQRTNFSLVLYALYLVTLGLSYRKASNAIKVFVERSHVAIWKWVQRIHGFRKIFKVNCRVSIFLVDETAVKVAGKLAWVWVAYEPYSKKIFGFLGLEIHTKLSFS